MQVRNRYNSTFRIHADKTSRPKRARLVRRNGRCRLKANGRKARLREKINAPNRTRFRELELLDVCEAALPGCWPNGRLTWAHGRKDRLLAMEERKYLVIRCCTVCHHRLDEEMSHEEMLTFVEDVIARRKVVA